MTLWARDAAPGRTTGSAGVLRSPFNKYKPTFQRSSWDDGLSKPHLNIRVSPINLLGLLGKVQRHILSSLVRGSGTAQRKHTTGDG